MVCYYLSSLVQSLGVVLQFYRSLCGPSDAVGLLCERQLSNKMTFDIIFGTVVQLDLK